MWIVIGSKEKTERVPGGRQVERRCSECGEIAMFYERRATSTLQLYFFDVYEYGSRYVMACGACGALFATDGQEAPATKERTGFARFVDSAERAGATIATAAERAFDRITEGVRTPERREGEGRTEHHTSRDDDPLAAEDAALEDRFRELERDARRIRIADD